MRIGSLFTGYGGLDMAAETFYSATTAWTCDIDPGASKIIAHRMPHAPNLGDITMINWDHVEPVDILAGGWPCQPFSLAGKRKGAEDDRALWPEVVRAVRTLRPRHVILENVAAIATAGELSRAVADLATLGYVGQWRCLRAADIGAPHGRARIFILATDADLIGHQRSRTTRNRRQRPENDSGTPANTRSGGWREEDPRGRHMVRESGIQSGRDESPSASGPDRHAAPDTSSDGRHERRPESTGLLGGSDAAQRSTATPADADHGTEHREWARAESRCGGAASTDANGSERAREWTQQPRRPAVAWGPYEPAIRRWESILGRLAPPPTEPGPKGAQRLSPRFEEWMMGLPDGWVTQVPGLTRNPQMKALGNGVVPQQALAALEMMERP